MLSTQLLGCTRAWCRSQKKLERPLFDLWPGGELYAVLLDVWFTGFAASPSTKGCSSPSQCLQAPKTDQHAAAGQATCSNADQHTDDACACRTGWLLHMQLTWYTCPAPCGKAARTGSAPGLNFEVTLRAHPISCTALMPRL